jgi:thioredoxin
MKKLSIQISILVLTIIPFSGCQGQSDKSDNTAKTTTANTQPLIEHLTNEAFKQKVFNYPGATEWKFIGEQPCIVDFYATWCGPCKMLAPNLEKIAEKYKGKIKVYKVDVDKEKELAMAFNVQSIPTILFIPKADKPQLSQGYLSLDDLQKAVKEVLNVQ